MPGRRHPAATDPPSTAALRPRATSLHQRIRTEFNAGSDLNALHRIISQGERALDSYEQQRQANAATSGLRPQRL